MAERGMLIGLTGPIGAGKSTACDILESAGAEIIHADQEAHAVYAPGSSAFRDIVALYGSTILDSAAQIDRRKLGRIVFEDPRRMKALTDIVWPATETRLLRRISQIRARSPLVPVILEAALLTEAGWSRMVDQIWLITAPESVRKQRIMQRNGLSEEEACSRIRNQETWVLPSDRPHRFIDNSGGSEQLCNQLYPLISELYAG